MHQTPRSTGSSPRRPSWGVPAAALAVALAALLHLPAPAAAAGDFYRFVDERGVVHVTNVPVDRRYSPVAIGPRGVRARPPRPRRNPNAFDGIIRDAAKRHGLPPALVKAVVATESAFDPKAVSRKGAIGLMQLMPGTAREVGVRNPYRPHDNIAGGSRYLRWMVDRYEDWILALAAYNAGPRAVDRYGGVPPYPETREYVRRVLHYYRRYYDDFGR